MQSDEPPVPMPQPPAFTVRDRELPQRLLGVLLWVVLLGVLWAFGRQ
jgi:hypothetical protein